MRSIEERWMNVGFSARTEHLPVADPRDGKPLHNADGTPKTSPHLILTFQHLNPQGLPELTVHIPFDENAKQELLRQITGVVVPQIVGVNGAPSPS